MKSEVRVLAEESPRESDQGLTTPRPWPCSGCMQRKRQQRGQDTARKRCCSNQINSYSPILCRALRRKRCSVSASTACPSPSASARQHQLSATAASICRGSLALSPRKVRDSGNRARAPRDVLRHLYQPHRHIFALTSNGGVGLAVPFGVIPQNTHL